MGVHLHIHETFFLTVGVLFALFLADRFAQKLQIHIIADSFHMPVLLCAEHIARAADFQVAHRNFKAGAKFRVFANRRKSPACNFGKLFAAPERKIGARPPRASAHAPADLVELGKPQAVGVFNNQRVAVGHVDAGFNNRRADENVNFALQKLAPNVA